MIIVLLAEGFEEIEALTPVDMLRRAECEVYTVGISSRNVTGAHGITVIADKTYDEIDLSLVDFAVFPGGMPGSLNLDSSEFTDKVIEAVTKNGGHLAAICAAPLIFGRRGILCGKRATCFPGFEGELVGATVTDEDFVTDGNITTGRGMEYSLPFSKELVRIAKAK
jgi:4-methyl-5(b-hydroxyethyl)-thiazole monophosphate biosynthesis